ncbi:peptidoglycan editing factor PgeF [Desulfonema ishimotonii]|uniref:peptidoglycan editing factor PgeF n=1 Tax=Desulfonema ishimotonii TaxID=45657 RepID=UPI001E5F5398|nr:peptidoglycan editing factor PgeF [Desulfonema ishimotonii]
MKQFEGIWHGLFTRKGGVSLRPWKSLNVGRSVGDSPRAVTQNRRRILRTAGGDRLVFAHQVHGTEILIVSENSGEAASASPRSDPAPADAMITDIPGQNLVIQVADCQPVLLYDADRHVAANIHSGWRGSIRNIIGKTISAMTAHFQSDPRRIFAGIGPSLGPCCAEFVNYQREIPEKYRTYRKASDHFDFWAISRDQLCDAGVLPAHIICSGLCTRCRTDLFFSYRGEHTTGRFAAVIGLR